MVLLVRTLVSNNLSIGKTIILLAFESTTTLLVFANTSSIVSRYKRSLVTEDKQRLINEAQTYANGILPKSRGRAARILEEARGYKSKVISKSEGEASRFKKILTEYNISNTAILFDLL
jgi:hypothetical protein